MIARALALAICAAARAYFRGRAAAPQLARGREMTRMRREIVSVAQNRFVMRIDPQDFVALAHADLGVAEKRETAVATTLLQKDLLARLVGEGRHSVRGRRLA